MRAASPGGGCGPAPVASSQTRIFLGLGECFACINVSIVCMVLGTSVGRWPHLEAGAG